MELIIDCVHYKVKEIKVGFPERPCFQIENFVGIEGLKHVQRNNPFDEPEGIALGCIVYVTEEMIQVTTSSFEEFETVCRYILNAYSSVGWELLEKVNL